MAFTGVCTEELCSVTQGIEKYRKVGATVLAISGDNPFAQEAWAKKEGISLTAAGDYEHNVAKSFDVGLRIPFCSGQFGHGRRGQTLGLCRGRERASSNTPRATTIPNNSQISRRFWRQWHRLSKGLRPFRPGPPARPTRFHQNLAALQRNYR